MKKASDIKVYQDLVALLTRKELEELHRGAHFVLEDNGYYALLWFGLPGAQARINSHLHHGVAFSIQGDIFPEFLCANRMSERLNHTWFQAERSGIRNLEQFIPHALHWMYCKASSRNVGPDGTSEHTDEHPIRIEASRILELHEKIKQSSKPQSSM